MHYLLNKKIGVAIGAGLIASFAFLPAVRAELVYENDVQRVEDRGLVRQNMAVAERVNSTVQVQQVPIAQTPVVVSATPAIVQPMVQQSAHTPEVENLTKSEMVRRERVRQELRNEDILSERLEELRLRDEKRRTEELLTGQSVEPTNAMAGIKTQQQEVVVAPITERPVVQQMAAPVAAPVVQQAQVTTTTIAPAVPSNGSVFSEDKTLVYIHPNAGLSNYNNTTYYDVKGRYSCGVDLGVSVSDNLSFELGYMFSEYGVSLNSTYWNNVVPYNGSYEYLAMKQNVADAGLKLHFLGLDAKFRPFIGGGASYSKSFINYDQKYLNYYNQSAPYMARDFELSTFMGFLSSGFDVRVGKGIMVGAMFKYYTVLSYRQNENINNQMFYGNNPWYWGQYANAFNALPDAQKQDLSNSVADANFYSITGGVSFFF